MTTIKMDDTGYEYTEHLVRIETSKPRKIDCLARNTKQLASSSFFLQSTTKRMIAKVAMEMLEAHIH